MSCYTSEQLLLLLHSHLLVSLSLLSLLAVCCFGHAEVECLPDQRSSLLTLKDDFSFQDYPFPKSADKLLSWTAGSNCCYWDGVSCDPSSGHVNGLDLSNRGIYGNISSSLFNLKSLQTLNLAYNNFDGPFPQSGFEKLTKLIHLNLSRCGDLSGQIPIGISRLTRLISLDLSWNDGIQLGHPNFQTLVRNLSQLRELHLDFVDISSNIEWSETLSISLPRLQVLTLEDCNVSGILPHNFFLLRNWTTLDLTYNPVLCGLLRGFPENSHLEVLRLSLTCINGSLSDSIGNLKYLRELQIAGEGEFGEGRRMLTGMIPSSIWNLTRLVRFRLIDFIGTIPTSIGNLTQLQYLDLSSNNLNGPFPHSLFSLPVLQTLILSYNNLIGTIPTSIGNLTQLEYLDLSSNNLNGPIPDSLFSLPVIQTLLLSSNNLIGTIPTSIGNLTQLQYLDLSSNNLNGPFPHSLFSLPVLQTLILSFNNLIGTIPTSIGNLTQLQYLHLSFNNLNGPIPDSLFSLPVLQTLILSYNNLIGTIPTSIGNLTQLEYLDLSFNNLNGPIPDSLFSLPVIQTLYLQHNQLQGQIPRSIFKFPALINLGLGSNNLSGTVELDMFERLKNLAKLYLSNNNMLSVHDVSDCYFHSFPKLQYLSLASCNLTKIPAFLRYQDNLKYLDLSNNRIHGDIPKWTWTFGNSSLYYLNLSCNSFTNNIQGLSGLTLGKIRLLDLHSNMLRGPIPLPISSPLVLDYSNNFFSSIIPSNISSYLGGTVQFLSFANNSLTGEIPSSICNVNINYGVLDLSDNNLTGFIPPCLLEGKNSLDLTGLNLRGNQLQGIIPKNITRCSLETLNLHGNLLEGLLPRSLANCSYLMVLDVGNNHLVDSFPFWLGNVTTLRVLILRGNGFYGSVEIPKSYEANYTFNSLQIFDLSSNHFEGNLPSECFNNMKVMMNNSQSDSSIVGFPYYSASILYQCIISLTSKGEAITLKKLLKIYTYIDLSNNRFQGNIPDVIGNLQGLHVLNFSHNALTGQIPSSIGNMKQLESLDLSENRLSGRIPQELDSLSFLAVLNVSNNNLVGIIPQGTQFSTFSNTSFKGNPGLCGKPLSMLCDNATPNRTDKVSQSKNASSSSNYVIGLGLFVGLGFGVGMAVVLVLQNIPLRFWKRHDNN